VCRCFLQSRRLSHIKRRVRGPSLFFAFSLSAALHLLVSGLDVRRFAILLFVTIALLALDRPLLDVVTRHRAMQATFTREGNRAPQFTAFIEAVRERTRPGDAIALVAFPERREFYGYCYLRANYLLAGRTVISTMTIDYRFDPSSLAQAQYTAAYGAHVGTGRVIWRGAGGELVRQR
jgi:hypothetical protein